MNHMYLPHLKHDGLCIIANLVIEYYFLRGWEISSICSIWTCEAVTIFTNNPMMERTISVYFVIQWEGFALEEHFSQVLAESVHVVQACS